MQDEPTSPIQGPSQRRRSADGTFAAASFICGNLWLLTAVVVFLCCSGTTQDGVLAFTAGGGWFNAGTYFAINGFCVVMAAACFVLTAANRPGSRH